MSQPEPGLTSDERADVIRLLRESASEFLDLIAAVTEEQWSRQAAPEQWSVQHIAEHLVLGERAMLIKIEEALAAAPHPAWEEQVAHKTEFLGRVLPHRVRKVQAPALLIPHRNWTRDETEARYRQGRARTMKFAEEVDQPMKDHLAEHPFPVFNMLNAYQWLLYIPLHNTRHNQQIAEALKEIA